MIEKKEKYKPKPKPNNLFNSSWHGYGQVGTNRDGLFMAHRVAYELAKGPIPKGMQLDHLCRNRACINPNHLEPVTNAENSRRGLRAKLNMSKANKIRQLHKELKMPMTQIAAMFSVHPTTVFDVLFRGAWC